MYILQFGFENREVLQQAKNYNDNFSHDIITLLFQRDNRRAQVCESTANPDHMIYQGKTTPLSFN